MRGVAAVEAVGTNPDGFTSLHGADRVLAILNVMGSFPDGISLNELARLMNSPQASVHRALAALRRADLGWRLDYCLVSCELKARVHDVYMLKDVGGSDHVPLGIVLLKP